MRIEKPPHSGRFRFRSSSQSCLLTALRRLDVAHGDLATAAVFLGVEGNLLALDQSTHAGALERGGMDEDVLASVIRLNEAEAFLIVIKFHGARIHGDILSLIEVLLNPRRETARLGSSMFGGSERAPGSQLKAKRLDCPAKCR